MVAGAADDEDEIRRFAVTARVATEKFLVNCDTSVFRKWRAGRKLVVGSEAFPFDGCEGVFENGFEKILEDAFAIAAVGHDDNTSFRLFEAHGIVTPAFVMAFLKEYFSVGRSVEAPAEAVAELNGIVVRARFIGERRELMFRTDANLRREELGARFRAEKFAIGDGGDEARVV